MQNIHHDGANTLNNKTFWVVPALGLPALVLGAWLLLPKMGLAFWQKDAPETETDPIVELAPADVATVSPASLRRDIPLTGSLSPLVQATVKAQVSGELIEVTVREGQSVNNGDVLVRIDTRNLMAEFNNQEAALEKARADLALTKLNRDNSVNLLAKRVISQNAYDTAESAYQANLANVKAAEAQLRVARIALEYATVYAPFAGTITQRLVQPGEKVDPGTSLLALVDLSRLELQAPAPADEVPSVKIGQVAEFQVGGFGERRFEGRVERINPMTDTSSRSIMLYLAVENPDGVLKGGMFAQGVLILEQTEPVTTIPLSAVHTQAGVSYVFVIHGAKVVRHLVKLGLRSEQQNLVEVREGVNNGERVVTAKIDSLKDGAPVVPPAVTADHAAPISH